MFVARLADLEKQDPRRPAPDDRHPLALLSFAREEVRRGDQLCARMPTSPDRVTVLWTIDTLEDAARAVLKLREDPYLYQLVRPMRFLTID